MLNQMLKFNNRFLKSEFIFKQQFAVAFHKNNQIQRTNSRKKKIKTKEDQEWEFQKSRNPFTRNVGMARQMKSLGVDTDDPVFKEENIGELFEEMDGTVEAFHDKSNTIRKQYEADVAEQRSKAKRSIVRKVVFGEKTEPDLLTWMEKEMIRFLHKDDPKEWTIERLSESFPATPFVIRKILRTRPTLNEDKINSYNKEVANNWKMLTKGKLELSSDYEKHLRCGYKNFSISSGLKNLAEQEILLEMEKKTSALPKPALPGEFASIIIDYNNKLAKDRREKEEMESNEVIDVPNLFADNTVPGTPVNNEIR